MASGSPSRATQTSWTMAVVSASRANRLRVATARASNSVDRVRGRQRLELMHHFAVQAQRNLARRDDVQAWSLVEQRADQGGDRVDDVLAAVQHQHRLGTGEPFDQALLAAGQVQGLGDEPARGRWWTSAASRRTSQTPPGA